MGPHHSVGIMQLSFSPLHLFCYGFTFPFPFDWPVEYRVHTAAIKSFALRITGIASVKLETAASSAIEKEALKPALSTANGNSSLSDAFSPRRQIGLGNGQRKSQEFADFVLTNRKVLREELKLCERATQRILGYSNNFLHKRLKTDPQVKRSLQPVPAWVCFGCNADSFIFTKLFSTV